MRYARCHAIILRHADILQDAACRYFRQLPVMLLRYAYAVFRYAPVAYATP